jgi:hypothetical protein
VVGIGRIAVADVARGGAMGMSNDETFIVLAVTVLS